MRHAVNCTGIWLCVAAIRLYQWTLSPFIGRHCRFQPTCSCYAEEAIRRFGLIKGTFLTARRIGRCHPWGGAGWDPVPEQGPKHRGVSS
ncbi:MAG: membrane protein insertion efficiency factor YidD [Phycisphaerales bacterium]|nr:membrane protein insertion efficiency factor YidD [Phycisphaerales bacterium]